MRLFLRQVLIVSALIVISACQPGVKNMAEPLTATQLFQGQQCGRQEPSAAVTRITDEQALDALVQRVGKPFSFADEIDFKQQLVLLVEMGMKPTTGYRLVLSDTAVAINQNKAVLTLAWHQPPPGVLLAQMLTSPCVLISLHLADYTEVELVDSNDKHKLVFDLKQ